MKVRPRTLRTTIADILGTIFFLLTIFIVVCLGKFLYFPTPDPLVATVKPVNKYSKAIEWPMETGHFHLIDDNAYVDEASSSSMCLRCHGNFSHFKSKDFRAYYNMHTFFVACETCHIRVKSEEKVTFQWFDNKSGEIIKEPVGSPGNYGAKIVPVKDGKRLDKFPNELLALEFMTHADSYSEEVRKRVVKELMSHISKDPVSCKECHRANGYINFIKLGYGTARSSVLSRDAIVKMLQEYKDFYMPHVYQ